jgi:glutamate dehydrogenase/leucine dehydrogenase
LGLWHPQEGVVNGHFSPRENEKIHKIGQLRYGVSKVLEDPLFSPDVARKYVVADMITGYGVSESIRHYYNIYGGTLRNKRVIIQGWGNVASAAGFYLAQAGAKIVGIIDREGGLINENGFTFDEVINLYANKKGNKLHSSQLLSFEEVYNRIWDVKADVFLPCAASRLVKKHEMEKLIQNGLELVSCGANVPFADSEIFFGPIADYVDNHVSLIPDFIANCGMARVFAFLMGSGIEMSDMAIFSDTSDVIKRAIEKVYQISDSKTGIAKRAFTIALEQLVK